MKPIIGLFPSVDNEGDHSLKALYVEAIEQAGGVPLIIPYLADKSDISYFIEICDGFCFTGGIDIDPARYGEEIDPLCGEISASRDEMELAYMQPILKSQKPVIGICRGAQVINVALGGTLYQDIPSMLGESFPHRQTEALLEYSHGVNIEVGTPLFELLKTERIRANSFHHQSVKALGDGLRVMARADDGIIEAFYLEGHPYLMAYQWHPERLCARDRSAALIFESFIEAAKKQ